MFDTLYSQVGGLIAVAVVAFAFLKGDEPERVGAGAYILALFASIVLQDDSRLHGPGGGLAMMAVDVVLAGVYAALAWKSRRSWPVWATGLQSLTVMCHLLALVDVRPPASAFIVVINLASYGILLAIALGVFSAWRDRRAAGLE